MNRAIRVLEVPLLLLAMAMTSWVNGSTGWAITLLIVSVVRLWINSITEK